MTAAPPLALDDPTAVAQLLSQVMAPATAQTATELIKEIMKDARFMTALVIQLVQNTETSIRQLAAILLRRRLVVSWKSLTVEARSDIKRALLARLIEDPAHLVRLSVAHVVSSLGKLILMEWRSELFQFLQKCSDSETESHREIAQVVFGSILDSSSQSLTSLYDDFGKIFEKGLTDPTSFAVRLAAIRGVAALANVEDENADFASLRRLIPSMVKVTREACEANKEDVVVFALEIFDTLADSTDALKDSDLPDLIRFMLFVGGNSNLSVGVREQALNFIHSVGKRKPKVVTKNNLVPDILKVVIAMAIQPDPEENIDDDELTPHRIASQCIDSLALNLPSRFVFEPVLQYVATYMKSENPFERRAALVLLGIMSEGCEDVMRRRWEELLPPVLNAFSDPSPIVRSGAAICLGQMAEFLQPEITQSHAVTMKVLLAAMVDPTTSSDENVQEKLCYAVELFCEQLEEFEIEAHLPNLMAALLHGLATAKGNRARENCIGAIGSTAQAAKGKFAPYVQQVFNILQEAMQQTSDDLIPLRARATHAAGCVIRVMPVEATVMYHKQFVESVFKGLDTLDHYDLRESSYRFFGSLCSEIKDEFAPLVTRLMPFVIAALKNTDGIVKQFEDDDNVDALNGVDLSEDEEDERRIKQIHIRTGFIDEQEAAIYVLCCLYRNVSGQHMAPWLKTSLECVDSLYRYFHSGVRQSVPNLAQAILINVHHTYLPPWAPRAELDSLIKQPKTSAPDNCVVMTTSENRGWEPCIPAKSLLHDNTLQLWVGKLWPVLFAMLSDDDDKEVVGDVCSIIGELLELLGPHLLQGSTLDGHEVHTALINAAVKIFSGEHPCQLLGDCGEIDEDEESRATEEYLFEGVSSLISGLAQTMGQQFQTPFSRLHPKILRLAVHKKSSGFRCIGIGCYADLIKTLGLSATPCIEPIIEPALEGVSQTGDLSLRRNSAFCLGTICEYTSAVPAVQNRLLDILKALHPIIIASTEKMRESELCVRDNAIAAIGRMLRGCTPEQIPHNEVIPLFLQSLPLKADFDESEGILKTILHLCFNGCDKAIIEQHQEELLRAVVGELVNGSLTKQTKDQAKALLANCVNTLGADHPIITSIGNRDERYKNLLEKLGAIKSETA